MLAARGAFEVDTPNGQRTLAAWLFFYILGGQVLLPVLLATLALARVKRHPIFISMCISWVFTSLLSTMLWYKHPEYYHHPEDWDVTSSTICLAQASLLLNAVPPMVSCSAFALVYHVWTRIRSTFQPEQPSMFVTLRTVGLIMCPFIVWAVFAVAGSMIVIEGVKTDPSIVRLGLYCELRHVLLGRLRSVFTMVVLLITAFYELRIIVTLSRRSAQQMHVDTVERALFIRVVAFGVYVLLGFALSMVSMFIATVGPDLYLASTAFVAFCIFGFQQDVLSAWCFWRHVNFKRRPGRHERRSSLTPLYVKTETEDV